MLRLDLTDFRSVPSQNTGWTDGSSANADGDCEDSDRFSDRVAPDFRCRRRYKDRQQPVTFSPFPEGAIGSLTDFGANGVARPLDEVLRITRTSWRVQVMFP